MYKIAVIGSGPSGLSAATHAAELGVAHVLLEPAQYAADTIYKYQKGKHVMAEPGILPLRSAVPFVAGSREQTLDAWNEQLDRHRVNMRYGAEVRKITGAQGSFALALADGTTLAAENVVLAIGLQGNLLRLGVPGESLSIVKCDMCKDLAGGPACVRSCPTGAALRVSPEKFLDYTNAVGL